MKQTIYINGRFMTQPQTGVQRYAREIISAFDSLLEDDQLAERLCICCIVPPGTPRDAASWKNITVEVTGINRGNLWEQVDLPLYLKGRFLFSPANTGPLLYRNQAVTFHDASIFAVPQTYAPAFRLKYWLLFRSLAQRTKIIFTNSKFSQVGLSHYLKQPVDRFKVIYLAGEHICRIQPDKGILDKCGLLNHQYLVVVGNQGSHKNFAMIRNAAESMKGDIKIVFVGGQDRRVFAGKVIQNISPDIIVPGYVSDGELKTLYLNALACVVPSYYEGFGLPVLEAMHCGCPVICARAGALPEIADDAALFFDPRSMSGLVDAVNRIHNDRQLRDDFIQKGNRRVKDFCWQITAQSTLRMMLDG